MSTTDDDIELAHLVNEIISMMGKNALRYSHNREGKSSLTPITGALCYLHAETQSVLPTYKRCLEVEDQALRSQVIMAILRAIRDLIIAFANDFPKNQRWLAQIQHSLYPSNVLTVLACFHHEQSPYQDESLYDSPIWYAMGKLIEFGKEHPDAPATASLPETLTWLATHPEAEQVQGVVIERGIASIDAIEELLKRKRELPQPVSEGVL